MRDLSPEALRDAGLAFLGHIVAVQSHEVTNAFSVINEMAGLQWDILSDAAKGEPVDLLELEQLCTRIRAHVRRGEETVRSINWMAHSVDQLMAELDVHETLEKLAMVASHWMRLRRVHLTLDVPKERAQLTVRPFFLAYALLLAVDWVTGDGGGAQTVALGYRTAVGGLTFSVEGDAAAEIAPERSDDKVTTLGALVGALGGTLEPNVDADGAVNRVVLFVPKRNKMNRL